MNTRNLVCVELYLWDIWS